MDPLSSVLTPHNIQLATVFLVSLILSICVHEFGHALVADLLGDPLPRAQGRVTLNPLAHIDPVGTLFFPLLSFFLSAGGAGFVAARVLGWGKPVQVSLSARHMTRRLRMKHSHLLVALAGPTMNVLFATLLSVLFIVLVRAGQGPLAEGVLGVVTMNLGLAMFNLIPCPPLDGGAILAGILPDGNPIVPLLERYGQWIFFGLLFTGALSVIMTPAREVAGLWVAQLLHWAT